MRKKVCQLKYYIIVMESGNNYIIQQLCLTKNDDKIYFPKLAEFNGSVSV